jgi:hypothetical protein
MLTDDAARAVADSDRAEVFRFDLDDTTAAPFSRRTTGVAGTWLSRRPRRDSQRIECKRAVGGIASRV